LMGGVRVWQQKRDKSQAASCISERVSIVRKGTRALAANKTPKSRKSAKRGKHESCRVAGEAAGVKRGKVAGHEVAQ